MGLSVDRMRGPDGCVHGEVIGTPRVLPLRPIWRNFTGAGRVCPGAGRGGWTGVSRSAQGGWTGVARSAQGAGRVCPGRLQVRKSPHDHELTRSREQQRHDEQGNRWSQCALSSVRHACLSEGAGRSGFREQGTSGTAGTPGTPGTSGTSGTSGTAGTAETVPSRPAGTNSGSDGWCGNASALTARVRGRAVDR